LLLLVTNKIDKHRVCSALNFPGLRRTQGRQEGDAEDLSRQEMYILATSKEPLCLPVAYVTAQVPASYPDRIAPCDLMRSLAHQPPTRLCVLPLSSPYGVCPGVGPCPSRVQSSLANTWHAWVVAWPCHCPSCG